MYHISVLILCFLSAAAFGNNTATSYESNTTTDVPATSERPFPCKSNGECDFLPGIHICFNTTCYNCYDCCFNKKENCPRRECFCTWFLTDEELKIVAQAVLGVAVFVTCVALVSLLWKVCARRLRRRHAATVGANLLDDTTSLSSQQVFVVERLRDRPPRYEDAARDFAIEKPPPYSEVVVEEHEQQRAQIVSVSGVPITLVGSDLMARDFAAPPPYSPPPARAATLTPPTVPHTPPVQRLRRCVRKVVMISRLMGRSTMAPEAENSSRPKGTVSRQRDSISTRAPTSSGLTTAAVTSEPTAVGRSCSQIETGASSTAPTGGAADEGAAPDSPTSTTA